MVGVHRAGSTLKYAMYANPNALIWTKICVNEQGLDCYSRHYSQSRYACEMVCRNFIKMRWNK